MTHSLPLKLHLEHTAISTYSRLLDKLTDSNKTNSHISHWKRKITELNIKLIDTDRTAKLNLHNTFSVNTQTFGENYKQHLIHSQINIYTDGSKTSKGTGAVFVIFNKTEMIHKDYIPLAYTATIFQAEVIAITRAIKFVQKMKRTLKPKYIKLFSDSRATLQALNSYNVKSTLVQEAVDQLNQLGQYSERITLNWIKAHNNHKGNEYADIMANIAANCTVNKSIYKFQ